MPIIRATDEAAIERLPNGVGIFLTVAGVPLALNTAKIQVVVLNEDSGLAQGFNVTLARNLVDGLYNLNFNSIRSTFQTDRVFALFAASGTDTIDSKALGRWKIVTNLDTDEIRNRITESREDVEEKLAQSDNNFKDFVSENRGLFEEFDKKITKDLSLVKDSVRDINSTLTIFRKTGAR